MLATLVSMQERPKFLPLPNSEFIWQEIGFRSVAVVPFQNMKPTNLKTKRSFLC